MTRPRPHEEEDNRYGKRNFNLQKSFNEQRNFFARFCLVISLPVTKARKLWKLR